GSRRRRSRPKPRRRADEWRAVAVRDPREPRPSPFSPSRPRPAAPGGKECSVSSVPRGFSLPELLVVLGILGAFFAIGVPVFHELLEQSMLRAACEEVALVFTRARGDAVFCGSDVGIKWVSAGGDVVFTIYRDGNG